jgi:hypothetical protein
MAKKVLKGKKRGAKTLHPSEKKVEVRLFVKGMYIVENIDFTKKLIENFLIELKNSNDKENE